MTVVVVVLVVGARTNYSFHRTLKNERERELIKPKKTLKIMPQSLRIAQFSEMPNFA